MDEVESIGSMYGWKVHDESIANIKHHKNCLVEVLPPEKFIVFEKCCKTYLSMTTQDTAAHPRPSPTHRALTEEEKEKQKKEYERPQKNMMSALQNMMSALQNILNSLSD